MPDSEDSEWQWGTENGDKEGCRKRDCLNWNGLEGARERGRRQKGAGKEVC